MESERMTPEEYLQKLEAEKSKEDIPQPVPTEYSQPEQPAKKKKKRRKKHYFLRFVIFVVLVAGIIYALQSPLFYVREIKVHGNRFYTPAQVIEMSGLETGKNMFFEIKTKPARDSLLETPYIKLVNIEKKPLHTLVVNVEERIEYAAVPNNGQFIVIDNEGLVLSIKDKQPELTLLEGINLTDSDNVICGEPINIEQTYLLPDTLALLKNIEDTDLYFYKVFFSSVIVRAYINEYYYCEGEPAEINANIEGIKNLIQSHYQDGINKGVIRVGSGGYLAFDPKID